MKDARKAKHRTKNQLQVGIRLNEDLMNELQQLAESERRTKGQLVRFALEEYLQRRNTAAA